MKSRRLSGWRSALSRGALCIGAVAAILSVEGCSKGSSPENKAEANRLVGKAKAAVDLRMQAEVFRLLATADLLKGLRAYGTPETNLRFAALAQEMWPGSNAASGWSLFLSTALTNVAHADRDQAIVGYYHPWSDIMLLTHWSKGRDGKFKITSADVMLGNGVRGNDAPASVTPVWATGQVYAPEAVGKLTAQTAKAFETSFGGTTPNRFDSLDPAVKEALPVAASMPLAQFRAGIYPLLAEPKGRAADAVRIWRELRDAMDSGKVTQTGDVGKTVTALSKLPPRVRGSIVPVSYLETPKAVLVMLASRINPDLYVAMQISYDTDTATLRKFDLLSFQRFYDASAPAAKEAAQ